MDNLAYTPYPRHAEGDRTRFSLSHAHPFPSRPPRIQPVRHTLPQYRPSTVSTSLHPPTKPAQAIATSYHAPNMGEAQTFFKHFVQHPEHVYLPSHVPAQQAIPQNFAFRPLEGYQPTYTAAEPVPTFKVESNTVLPIPALLPGSVDASQYESIAYSEWLQASTEYQSLSPASLDSHADSPTTPADWEPDHALARSAFPTIQEDEPVYRNVWIAQAQPASTYIAQGMPSTQKGSSLDHSNVEEENSQHGPPEQLHIETAAPQDLSLAGSSSGSDDGMETAIQTFSHSDDSEPADAEDELRRQQDDLLIRMREEGYKYGEIKRHGRFKEAESTLRGRYRSLTKAKLERLRSPQWKPNDVVLLRRAVRRYTNSNLSNLKTRHGGKKVPWKKIGEWIKNHGGSYLFAPATCAKKWETIKGLAPESWSTLSS